MVEQDFKLFSVIIEWIVNGGYFSAYREVNEEDNVSIAIYHL